MVDWYKHDIPDWMDGTEHLDAECYRTYHVIVQLIMLNEGPIRNNEHGIAGRCRQSLRTYRRAIKDLCERRLIAVESGKIGNHRAFIELKKIDENRSRASKGGKASRKSLKINDESEASLNKKQSLREKTRLDESREEKIQDIGAHAPLDDWPLAYRDIFWKAFPNKVGKPKALARLDACRKRGVAFADIMTGLHAYIRDKPPDRSWLNPETFINQERWADQPALPLAGAQNGKTADTVVASAARDAERLKREIAAIKGEGTSDYPEYPAHIQRLPRGPV